MAETKKRRKPKAQRKEDSIRDPRHGRPEEDRSPTPPRGRALGVSSWLLTLGLREAQKDAGGGAE